MSDSIKISPKHGFNPTIPICFFCGEEKNEVALLGKMKDDMEAPRNMILDYEPCDKCKEMMGKGITVIAASSTPMHENQPPLQKNAYPTGEWCVITEDGLKRLCDDEALVQSVLEKRVMLMDPPTFTEIFANVENDGEDGDV